MSLAVAALRAGAAAILTAEGRVDLAAIVEGGDVELTGAPASWTMGARVVEACRVALALDAPAFVALRADASRFEAVRAAFAAAIRSPITELAELLPVLRLPSLRVGFHHAYRDAAPRMDPERPPPEAVLAGAVSVLEASGDRDGAAMLGRASLEMADAPGGGSEPLVRCVVRLDAPSLVRATRDGALADRMKEAVRHAATRAIERVASVDLAVSLG